MADANETSIIPNRHWHHDIDKLPEIAADALQPFPHVETATASEETTALKMCTEPLEQSVDMRERAQAKLRRLGYHVRGKEERG